MEAICQVTRPRNPTAVIAPAQNEESAPAQGALSRKDDSRQAVIDRVGGCP